MRRAAAGRIDGLRPPIGLLGTIALLGALGLRPGVVRAQEPTGGEGEAPTAEDGAAGPQVETAEGTAEGVRARARALFEEGMRLLEAEDWEAAVQAFASSYELRPNASVLYNLANGQRLLFDYPASIVSFRRYLATEGDRVPAERRAEIDGFLAEMLSKVGTVTVAAPEGATLAVDGHAVGTAPLDEPLLVTAGEHVLTAELTGHAAAVQRIHAERGELLQVALAPQALGTGGTASTTTSGGVSGGSTTTTTTTTTTRAGDDWGTVPLGLAVAANLRALEFEQRAFIDNFGWSVHGGFQATDWFAAVLEVSFPAIDFALWARFAFLRLDWFSLAAAPGLVLTTGALDDRGVGFAACLELLAEFRVWRGLTIFVAPGAGIDVLRATWVVPLSLGVAYYI
ncbi:MAG: PEGA domain-containing protein [Deltaproteobacteria bacterium]|nr:PEGA domain-containing protein [Deltaproteobacteria bacterium]